MPVAERHLYHVLQEKQKFDSQTGERLSVPFVQKYGQREFEAFIKRRLEGQGWKLTILFDPTAPVREVVPAQHAVKEEKGKEE